MRPSVIPSGTRCLRSGRVCGARDLLFFGVRRLDAAFPPCVIPLALNVFCEVSARATSVFGESRLRRDERSLRVPIWSEGICFSVPRITAALVYLGRSCEGFTQEGCRGSAGLLLPSLCGAYFFSSFSLRCFAHASAVVWSPCTVFFLFTA